VSGREFHLAAESRDLDRALRELDLLLSEDPLHVRARMNRGAVRAEMDDALGAEVDFRFVIRHAPDWDEPHYYLARVLYTQWRLDEAQPLFERAVELARRRVPAAGDEELHALARKISTLAGLLLFQKETEAAIRHLDESIAAYPNSGNLVLRCLAHFSRGDEKAGDADLAAALAKDRGFLEKFKEVDGELQKPMLAYLVTMVREHLLGFPEILFLAPPEKATVRVSMATVFRIPQIKDLTRGFREKSAMRREVEELFEQLPRAERRNPELAAAQGTLFRKLGLKTDPVVFFLLSDFSLKLARDIDLRARQKLHRVDDYLWRAGAHYRVGKLDAAQSDLEDAISLDPTSAKAHYGLATVLALRGDAERCALALRKARQFGWTHLDFVAADPDFERVRDAAEVRAALGR